MKKNDIFLAHLVSFDRNSLLFNPNDLEDNFYTEEYRLVILRDNRAYDLINYKPYYIITNAMNLIDDRVIDKIKPNTLYVFTLYDLVNIWDDVRKVYGINKSLEEFIEGAVDIIDNINSIINNKVIDFQKIKKLMIERK